MSIQSVETRQQLDPQRQEQRESVTTQTQLEHGGLLGIVHPLEQKLATAAPGRERDWTHEVLVDLRRLRDIFREHVESAGSEDGLFAELAHAVPNWLPRMERLQQRQEGLLHQMNSLISQIDNHRKRDVPDFSDIRRRTAAAIDEVRTIQALENDLLFECFETDLGVGD
jgi:hypothetical protein